MAAAAITAAVFCHALERRCGIGSVRRPQGAVFVLSKVSERTGIGGGARPAGQPGAAMEPQRIKERIHHGSDYEAGVFPERLQAAIQAMEAGGVRVMVSKGSETTILGAEGDAGALSQEQLSQLPGVERVMRVSEPYKKANRKYHPDDSVIHIGGGVSVGGGKIAVIAGPCSVESEEQILEVARSVQRSGAAALRGGAYKPRTSPYAFQGKGVEGVLLLDEARKDTGLPIVSELMSADQLPSLRRRWT